MNEFPRTSRTTLRRLPKRGVYDRDRVNQILDEALVCHLGFVVDHQPYVIPTLHVRVGETLYVHGSPASRMLKTLQSGVEVCAAVTLVDGLVLARSAFHHSMNYRSVMIFGTAQAVAPEDEKIRVLRALMYHLVRGRWEEVREPSPEELRGTLILSLPITEASAKVRTGPPMDEEEDYGLPIWAGVVPLSMTAGTPQPDPRLATEIPLPQSLQPYSGPGPATPEAHPDRNGKA